MDIGYTAVLTALIAGVISFLSPCVLAALPTYTAFLGTGHNGLVFRYSPTAHLVINTGIFLSAFIAVFLMVGTSTAYVGQALQTYHHTIQKFGAILMVLMGLHLSNLLTIPIKTTHSRSYSPASTRPLSVFLLGLASTAAWTPCNLPLLAPILAYASASPSSFNGIALFLIYALGFCVPYALLSVLFQKYLAKIRLLSSKLHIVTRMAGIIVAILGVLVFFEIVG